MFLTLLIVTFLVALIVTTIVARAFQKPVSRILERIFREEIGSAWGRYVAFALYVVGISGGVRIWELEKYITPHTKDQVQIVLNSDRWILEVYRTIIETLQSTACILLVFFIVTLFAYLIVRSSEKKPLREA